MIVIGAITKLVQWFHACLQHKQTSKVSGNKLKLFWWYWWLNPCWFPGAYMKGSINMNFKMPLNQV